MDVLSGFLARTAVPMQIIPSYGWQHLLIAVCVLGAAAALAALLTKRKVPRGRVYFCFGLLLCVMELFKQVFLTYVRGGNYSWSDFPFQLCSVTMYLCLLYPVLKKRGRETLESFMAAFSLLGGIAALCEPTSSFTCYWALTVHSLAWHGILIMLGLYSAAGLTKTRKYLPAGILYLVLAAAAVCLNAGLSGVADGNINLFFLGPNWPDMVLCDEVYDAFGWQAETLGMAAAAFFGGWAVFRLCRFAAGRRKSLA